jgi:diadenosine tetraphosphate (Ap4A) HIT family hydrolase
MTDNCGTCGFELWIPVTKLKVSHVGLYDDARFPGRMIVSLDHHFEHFDQIDPKVLADLMIDIQTASLVLQERCNADRVNIAILGNKDPHVHVHVIPRRVTDVNFGVAPWENAEPHRKLAPEDRLAIIELLQQGFSNFQHTRES